MAAVPWDVTRRVFLACKAMCCLVIYRWRGKKKEITFHFGRWCFILFIESVLIMGGTLGRYGTSSVENMDAFFFYTIANLTKTAC